jgi:hypothetical protein
MKAVIAQSGVVTGALTDTDHEWKTVKESESRRDYSNVTGALAAIRTVSRENLKSETVVDI